MGTIGNTLAGYYQLANLLSSGSGSSFTSAGSAGSSSSLDSLAAALDAAASSGNGSGGSNAFLLDLSPQAQQLLSGGSSGTTSSSSGSSFNLTQTQITAIKNIIEKYKNDPLDQTTFNEIQNALQAAGLSPQTLGAMDQVNGFNPTNVLLSALSGDYTSISTPAASASAEQTKETNYMQNIVSLWKSDVSSASSGSGSSASGAASSSSQAGL